MSDPRRLSQYAFKPGQSGNPGGRPKAAKIIAELIAKETQDGAELVAFALAVIRGTPAIGFHFASLPDDPKSVTYCHNWLTERVAGKAPQDIDLHVGGLALSPAHAAMLEALKMSPHERRARIEELRERLPVALAAAAPDPGDDDGE